MTMPSLSLLCVSLAALAFASLAACGDGAAASDAAILADADPLAPDAAPPVADELLAGEVYLAEVVTEPTYAVLQVRMGDAPMPQYLVETAREGACVLRVREPTPCEPDCAGFCIGENMCHPFPLPTSAGDLTVTGTSRALTFDELDGFYQLVGEYPTDLFTPGAEVTLAAAGGVRPAFAVSVQAPRPLQGGPATDELDLDGDGDVRVTWTVADPGSRVRLTLNANSSGGHGSPYAATITCEADDDAGELVVARRLLDGFPETYRWEICAGRDCPLSELARYRRAAVSAGDGLVALTLASRRSFYILHAAP